MNMFKLLIRLFLFIHIMGDFYLQSAKLAKNKRSNYKAVLLHGLIYLVTALVIVLPFYSLELLITAAVFAGVHLLVDSIKFVRHKTSEENSRTYLGDLTAHLLTVFLVTMFLVYRSNQYALYPLLAELLTKTGVDVASVFLYLELVLILAKPINISIKRILDKYKVDEKDEGVENAGALIGTLERIIIALLISIDQFNTIGLVLTAKSVARYNRIAEDKKFAEYYLLGTLLSTLLALASPVGAPLTILSGSEK